MLGGICFIQICLFYTRLYPLYIHLACDSDVETSATHDFGSPPSDIRLRFPRGCRNGNAAVETEPTPIIGLAICAAFRRAELCAGEGRGRDCLGRWCRKPARPSGERNTIDSAASQRLASTQCFLLCIENRHGHCVSIVKAALSFIGFFSGFVALFESAQSQHTCPRYLGPNPVSNPSFSRAASGIAYQRYP